MYSSVCHLKSSFLVHSEEYCFTHIWLTTTLYFWISTTGRATYRVFISQKELCGQDNSLVACFSDALPSEESGAVFSPWAHQADTFSLVPTELLILFSTHDPRKQLEVGPGKYHQALWWLWGCEMGHSHPCGLEDECAKAARIFPVPRSLSPT